MKKIIMGCFLLTIYFGCLFISGCGIKKRLENVDLEAECLSTTPVVNVICPTESEDECYLTIKAAPNMVYSVFSYSNQMGDVYSGIIQDNESVKLLPRLFLTTVTIEPYVNSQYYNCANHQVSIGKSKYIISDNDTIAAAQIADNILAQKVANNIAAYSVDDAVVNN